MNGGNCASGISRRVAAPSERVATKTLSMFTTDDSCPENRLSDFDQLQVTSEHPTHVPSNKPQLFSARARSLDLGMVNIDDLVCSPARVVRTSDQVQELDPKLIALVSPRAGRLILRQAGREATLDVGDMALYTSSSPFEIQIENDTGPARLLRMQMPRSMVSTVFPRIDCVAATRWSGHHGLGAHLGEFLDRVATQAEGYGPADLPRLANLAIDLLAATLAHHFDARSERRNDGHSMLTQILGFIREHLHDAQLSPPSIATAHHISVSYLHRLFQAHDTTLSAWIRRERLDRARRDLTDQSLRDLPIHRIAARWGYTDHATFTRAFRTDFGLPPREYRHRLMQTLSNAEDARDCCATRPSCRPDGTSVA